MTDIVLIFGKDAWPHTTAARAAYSSRNVVIRYIDVKRDANGLAEMLKLTGGGRKVPVIVEQGKVTIGFGGTWTV